MAPGKVAADFNAIIDANRQRRKHEALANEIFSKGRRSSAPGAGFNTRKPSAVPSLASRIGVAKRTASTSSAARNPRIVKPSVTPAAGNVDTEWTHDLHNLNNPAGIPRGPRASRPNREKQLVTVINGSSSSPAASSQFNIIGASKPSGFSIKGLAGPYLIEIKNLVPGTTAADIQSAIAGLGGSVLACEIIAERPKVIAEVEFSTKEGADIVVDTLNNTTADGNKLHVYHKPSATSSKSAPITPLGPRADAIADRPDRGPGYGGSDRYTPRDRRRENERDNVMDGSYGFEDRMDTDDDNRGDSSKGRGGLYSDNLINSRSRGRRNGGRNYR